MTYEHGRFVWFELLTKDLDRASAFYPETLPWRIAPTEMQDGSHYTMIQVGEAGVGGMLTPPVDMPSHWISYVSVADVDQTAEKVKAAGGATHAEAFDVAGVGRMQAVSDPHGGAFCLFKAETADPSRVDGPGSLHWNELWSPDPAGAVEFYRAALGYSHDEMPMPHGTYYVLKDGDQPRGGVVQAPSSDIPPMWLQYITVDDCDAALARATEHGANVISEPVDAPGVGRFAVFRDPLGAVIGVIKPADA